MFWTFCEIVWNDSKNTDKHKNLRTTITVVSEIMLKLIK